MSMSPVLPVMVVQEDGIIGDDPSSSNVSEESFSRFAFSKKKSKNSKATWNGSIRKIKTTGKNAVPKKLESTSYSSVSSLSSKSSRSATRSKKKGRSFNFVQSRRRRSSGATTQTSLSSTNGDDMSSPFKVTKSPGPTPPSPPKRVKNLKKLLSFPRIGNKKVKKEVKESTAEDNGTRLNNEARSEDDVMYVPLKDGSSSKDSSQASSSLALRRRQQEDRDNYSQQSSLSATDIMNDSMDGSSSRENYDIIMMEVDDFVPEMKEEKSDESSSSDDNHLTNSSFGSLDIIEEDNNESKKKKIKSLKGKKKKKKKKPSSSKWNFVKRKKKKIASLAKQIYTETDLLKDSGNELLESFGGKERQSNLIRGEIYNVLSVATNNRLRITADDDEVFSDSSSDDSDDRDVRNSIYYYEEIKPEDRKTTDAPLHQQGHESDKESSKLLEPPSCYDDDDIVSIDNLSSSSSRSVVTRLCKRKFCRTISYGSLNSKSKKNVIEDNDNRVIPIETNDYGQIMLIRHDSVSSDISCMFTSHHQNEIDKGSDGGKIEEFLQTRNDSEAVVQRELDDRKTMEIRPKGTSNSIDGVNNGVINEIINETKDSSQARSSNKIEEASSIIIMEQQCDLKTTKNKKRKDTSVSSIPLNTISLPKLVEEQWNEMHTMKKIRSKYESKVSKLELKNIELDKQVEQLTAKYIDIKYDLAEAQSNEAGMEFRCNYLLSQHTEYMEEHRNTVEDLRGEVQQLEKELCLF